MSLKEVLWGTPREIQADQRYGELSRMSQRRKLNTTQEAELAETRGLSRRLFLRRGAAVIGTTTVLATPIGAYLVTRPDHQANEEEIVFWQSLEGLSNTQKVGKVDQFYTTHFLTEAVARGKVFPVWTQHFTENGHSDLDPQQILQKIRFEPPPENDRTRYGAVKVNYTDKTIGDPRFSFDSLPSNKIKTYNGESLPGIIFQRSILIHELGHFDAQFKDATEFANFLIANSLLNTELKNPDHAVTQGFNLALVAPNGAYRLFFAGFDEAANDIRGAHINSKAGVDTLLAYSVSIYLRRFLRWINYDMERFIQLHRASDLEQLMRDFGKRIIDIHKGPNNSKEAEIMEGFKVITSFNTTDPDSLEALFPGFKQAVLSEPGRYLIR